jgi:hypothetical protein
MAEKNILTGAYHAACFECSARSIANSPMFFNARQWSSAHGGEMHYEYKQKLVQAADGAWRAMHESVKRWAARIEASREAV